LWYNEQNYALKEKPMGIITKLFGTRSQRELKKIQPIVDKILSLEEEYKALSEEALKVARLNAQHLGTEIEFLQSDLWSALEGRSFDLVTANLPYVSESEYAQCDPEIFFEPVMALTAHHEGLELMEEMIAELPTHLSPGGWAIFELSPRQNQYIRTFGESRGFAASAVKDLEGKERFVLLRRESF
jgi:release factor glutamine methyltransferase